ncbi:hypothetical protein [Risungbinella massiliensis]|uniref:hypothetical protein n=1 Tax=Risungbinella massiliensis TaxID=1329796 RepID=UPI0005CC2A1B|nr:hypothetical protein [Risungbinella massiliensis]
MAKRHKKERFTIDLPPDLKEWAEQVAIKLSYERGSKVSRNQVIEESLILFKEHLESKQK